MDQPWWRILAYVAGTVGWLILVWGFIVSFKRPIQPRFGRYRGRLGEAGWVFLGRALSYRHAWLGVALLVVAILVEVTGTWLW